MGTAPGESDFDVYCECESADRDCARRAYRHPIGSACPLDDARHGNGDSDFEIRLRQVINQTMEVDIPQYANMNASTGRKLKKLLAVIAQSVPFKPVMDSIATVVGVSRNVRQIISSIWNRLA